DRASRGSADLAAAAGRARDRRRPAVPATSAPALHWGCAGASAPGAEPIAPGRGESPSAGTPRRAAPSAGNHQRLAGAARLQSQAFSNHSPKSLLASLPNTVIQCPTSPRSPYPPASVADRSVSPTAPPVGVP